MSACAERICDDEHEMQYYESFNATMFIEAFRSMLKDVIDLHVEELREQFEEFKDDPETSKKLELRKSQVSISLNATINDLMGELEPVIRNFIEIPSTVLLPINDRIASANFKSLKEEVAKMEQDLILHKVYYALLQQQTKEINKAEKYADQITNIYIEGSEKIDEINKILAQYESLSEDIKFGEDVACKLQEFEKLISSFGSLDVSEESNEQE